MRSHTPTGCSVLSASDNQNIIFQNLIGAGLIFQSITCFSDAGMPSINIQRDEGDSINKDTL